MALTLQIIPGKVFQDGELLTTAKLNQLGQPTVYVLNDDISVLVPDGSVTVNKLADSALTADVTGLAKMQDGFLAASASGHAKFADGFWDNTTWAKFAAGFWTPVAPVVASSRGLVIKSNAGSPNTTVDIAADEIVLKNATGDPHLVSAVAKSAAITSAGANGLDAGGEGASTWYYIWVIYNANSGTVASLLSTSSTAPTLPANYTHKALVGAIYNDGGSNFVPIYQVERDVWTNEQVVFTAQAGTLTYASQSLAAFVPPLAKAVWGMIGGTDTSGGNAITIAGDGNGMGAVASVAAAATATWDTFAVSQPFEVPMPTAQTVYWKSYGTASRYRLVVTGWTF